MRTNAMPELPEVETTRRGIAPHVEGHRVMRVVIRQPRLRWPIPADISQHVSGSTITTVQRRAKYLLVRTTRGTVLLHLGMSGSLRLVPAESPPQKHDHVDLVLDTGLALRLTDPRRFGAMLWCDGDPAQHALLRDLGPEPLSDEFDGTHLWRLAQGRRASIKTFLMDQKVVVGVGNIYASESLFLAGIHPERAAGRVSMARYQRLAAAVKEVLSASIAAGGTTLRDFVGGDGQPGYFAQQLRVYGRAGEPCIHCGQPIRHAITGQRSTYFCVHCQR